MTQRPNVLIMGAPNKGKAQPLTSIIKTPNGDLLFRDVKKDDRIFGDDGKVYTVTDIHPQGILPVSTLHFNDGSNCMCSEDHLWTVTFNGETKDFTVADLIEFDLWDKVEFPINKPTQTIKTVLPIPPSILGFIMREDTKARGSNSILALNNVSIKLRNTLVHLYKDAIITNIASASSITLESKELTYKLNMLSPTIIGKYREIPKEYLLAGTEQRQELFDAIFEDNHVITESPMFAKSILELARSLGNKTILSLRRYDHKYLYRIFIDTKPKKLIKIVQDLRAEMLCISTSNPSGLYMTDNWIVTHNTYSLRSLATGKEDAKKVLYINSDAKALPWFGTNDFSRYTLPCPTLLPDVIASASMQKDAQGNPKFNTIIVDTITRFLDGFVSKFVTTKEPKYVKDANGNIISNMNYIMTTKTGLVDSMSAWGRMGTLFKDTMDAADQSGCQVIFVSHMGLVQKPDGSYTYDAPIQGQVGKVGILSWFSIALVADHVDMDEVMKEPDSDLLTKTESQTGTHKKYVLQVKHTASTGEYPIRTIDGMFTTEQHYIDNDLSKLLKHLDACYAQDVNELTF